MINCTYCGEPADTRDHVVPNSWHQLGRRLSGKAPKKDTVDCCRECNTKLGNIKLHTIAERAEYLNNHYTKLYCKLSGRKPKIIFTDNREQIEYYNEPHWNEEELAELGESLRQTIIVKQALVEKRKRQAAHTKYVGLINDKSTE